MKTSIIVKMENDIMDRSIITIYFIDDPKKGNTFSTSRIVSEIKKIPLIRVIITKKDEKAYFEKSDTVNNLVIGEKSVPKFIYEAIKDA